jgi:hypothetical protein
LQRTDSPRQRPHDVGSLSLHAAHHVGQIVVDSLAEEQQRLAAALAPVQMARESLEDGRKGLSTVRPFAIARVAAVVQDDGTPPDFLGALDRCRSQLVAGELIDGRQEPCLVAGEVLGGRRQSAGRDHCRQVPRPHILLDEPARLLAHDARAPRVDMDSVQHEDEDPGIFDRFVRRHIGRHQWLWGRW